MGIITGLKSINAHVEAEEAKFSGGGDDRQKTKWFSLKDKQAAKIAFLQELDSDSENYSEKNGLGFIAVEHQNPKNFRRKALCSIEDEGACFGCEEHKKDYKAGWRQKTKLYINVLVDNGVDEPYVAVLSQGTSGKSVTPNLIEHATEFGTITDKWFKIKRKGSGLSDTSYTLTALSDHGLNVEDYELFDLEKVVRNIPYAEQSAHYLDEGNFGDAQAKPEPALATAGSVSVDNEW